MLVHKFPTVDINLWDDVDTMVLNKLDELMQTEQCFIEPPMTIRHIQDELAQADLYASKPIEALKKLFYLKKSKDGKSEELRRWVCRPIERALIGCLSDIFRGIDGLYIPQMLPYDGAPPPHPPEIALFRSAQNTALNHTHPNK